MKINKEQAIALMFSGQGNPVVGMGSDIWDVNETTRQIWDCANDIAQTDLRRVCLRGPMNKLVQTTNQQLIVTAINTTLYSLCQEHIDSSYIVGCCGHSVGEYSALYAAEAITLEDLFKIIRFRSQLMDELSKQNKGLMYAVKGIDYATLEKLTEGFDVDISCDNSQSQQVIGGTSVALSNFSRFLLEHGYESVKLGVSGAWHTHLMKDGVEKMRDFLAQVVINSPKKDVIMNVTGQVESDPERIKENLALHLTQPVQWTATMAKLLAHPQQPVFLEISNKAYLGHILNDFPDFHADRIVHCRQVMGAL